MKFPLELRYAILFTLLMLLWLLLEDMVGLHDKYVGFYFYSTIASFIAIAVFICRRAILEKAELTNGLLTFKQAFSTGVIIMGISAVLVIPEQYVFHTFINTDFFDHMVTYSVERAITMKLNEQEAKMHALMNFNLQSYIIKNIFFTFIFGSGTALATAYWMRNKK